LIGLNEQWITDVNRLAKPNVVRMILANKSDYFLKTDLRKVVISKLDSDEEEDSDEEMAQVRKHLLNGIGKLDDGGGK